MRRTILLLVILLTPLYFYAWGKEGHMIVAEIAKSRLEKDIVEKIQFYLGNSSFEEASVWMDEMRSDHSYDYMRVWHYVNVEENETYVQADGGDLVSALKFVINELKNFKNKEREEVAKDLKILFHLCGDITQPMHVGYASDRGGNDVKLKLGKVRTNLHHVWDSDIISDNNITLDSCVALANRLSESEKNAFVKIDVFKWMQDSRTLLFSAYNLKNKSIDTEYLLRNKEIVELQLIKGGYRLAAVLNEIFK